MLPKRALYDYNIIKCAKILKIPHFIGVFCRDKLPLHPKHKESAVINLDNENNVGTHWVAYRKIGKRIKYFDSFGDLPPPLKLQSYLNNCKIEYNYTRYQKFNTTNCGHLCLEFLSCTR